MREFHEIMPKFFLKSITLENYHGMSGYYEIDKTELVLYQRKGTRFFM